MSKEILNKIGTFFIENDKIKNFQGFITKENNNYKFEIYNHDLNSGDNKRFLINGTIGTNKISFIIFNKPINTTRSFIPDMGKIEKRIYLVEHLFIGTFFDRVEDIKFKDIILQLNNMGSTIYNPLPITEVIKSGNDPIEKYPLLLKHLPNFDDFELKIEANCSEGNSLRGNGMNIQFKESRTITLSYKSKQDINRIIEDAKIIEHLFTFLTEKSEIIKIQGIKEEKWIDLKLGIISDNYEDKFKHQCIKLTEDNIESIFYSWFDNFKKLNGVYELYYSIEGYNIPAHILLTTYTQILESYHRHKYGKNNSKFKDRIIQICDDLKQYEIFEQIIKPYNLTQIDDFAENIKINRNYYTHYDKKNKENAFKGRKLIKLDHRLKRLINLIFLKELKLDPNEINKITSNMPRFQELIFLDDIEEKGE